MAKLFDVSRFFIDYSQKTNEPITNIRLNKLLYFAYGMHLSRTSEKLFEEPIEAWEYGPVIPDVYHRYKCFCDSPIIVPSNAPDRNCFSDQEYESLIEAARLYGKYVTSAMVRISQATNGAWDATMRDGQKSIPDELIAKDFAEHSLDAESGRMIYGKLISGISYTDSGRPIFPCEDEDDCYWPEYDDV